ncbi:hypothetical protein COCSUDRAFT_55557 [Coccomyxa subellipsoidea C-169]|uniref:Dihydrolipoamide acetyltransferase component of pyruvate dehydrogenase complex n=1 Tax=Coccomyxa subellipsoidea (strain C-169) TaxID=574566 RepID=I0ZA89_COCSC|nr:hypothetical protein COCSUDRAFT_55557 [Coccomyxa subellipsoidea C-169]EIE27558.1 hypothetical protein COCSUDRAFT_55557 [Coccomyxa subellipsoidea C-169]|eukprot:XP_005652102.1 hypothetical protein COCSUDRAFT_55557 [Coccomyxa subellipsoidea C-169]
MVHEGDTVEEFDQICEVQSDKAAVEITSQYAGVIRQLHHTPGSMVQVGEALLSIEMEDEVGAAESTSSTLESVADQPPTASTTAAVASSSTDAQATLASPAVRRVAREHGINLASIPGSGPDGRITKGVAYATEATTTHGAMGYRRAMVRSMTAAGAVPHFHYCDEISVGALLRLRTSLLSDPALKGLKLTFLPFMLKAVSVAMRQWPDINGSLSADGTSLLQHHSHNLGVAMATPSGLVVPNIKGVESRSIVGIAQELARLQGLAQAGRLGQEDLSGGTLTVSNIGAIGGTYATPLVNVPEVAIVALGKVRDVAQQGKYGELEMVPMLAASWGADHRVIDGATLARFSNSWKAFVEEPERLLLHLH